MKTNELRIGNLIYSPHSKENKVVTAKMLLDYDARFNFLYQAIPLTGDWLLKFGFEHHPDVLIWNHENICVSYTTEVCEGVKLYANHEYEIGASFQYVHQLQNIYFALNGTEL